MRTPRPVIHHGLPAVIAYIPHIHTHPILMKLLSAPLTLLAATAILTGCTSAADTPTTTGDTLAANPVIKTIMARRSVRKYADRPVEREKLELIANCGINAPNGMNRQPWEVRIVDNPDYIKGITDIYIAADTTRASQPGFKNMFRNAPAVIFIASPTDGSGQVDCGLLGENMVLAAQSLGLGTCCLGGPIRFMTSDTLALPYLQRLSLPQDYTLLYAIGVGYPDETPEAKPRDTTKVRFID